MLTRPWVLAAAFLVGQLGLPWVPSATFGQDVRLTFIFLALVFILDEVQRIRKVVTRDPTIPADWQD